MSFRFKPDAIDPDWIKPDPEDEDVEKVLSGNFGNPRKRRAELIRRLKQKRKYGLPVRGGKKKKTTAGTLTGQRSKKPRGKLG